MGEKTVVGDGVFRLVDQQVTMAQARETVAAFMLAHGIATGHGDTLEALLGELGAAIDELRGNGKCPDCDGSGRIAAPTSIGGAYSWDGGSNPSTTITYNTCPICHGTGKQTPEVTIFTPKPTGCPECKGTGRVSVRQGDPDDWGAPEQYGFAICSLCHAENITVTSESLKEWHEHNKPEDRCPDCKGTGKVKALPELNAEGEQYDICPLCHGGIRDWRTPLPELPGAAEAIEAALNDLQESENHLLDRLLNGPFRPK